MPRSRLGKAIPFGPWRWPRRLVIALLSPLILLMIGAVGFRWIEGDTWSWLDAFYMSTITLTTVGFAEVHDLSAEGRRFTIVLCLGGIFSLAYAAGEVVRLIVSGEFQQILGRSYMAKELAQIKDHMIICGYGRMGKMVSHEFEQLKIPYVIIDRNEEVFASFDTEYGLMLVGDASLDEVLRRAGVERARGLVAVLSSDADNLYIVLTSKLLNKNLHIVSRAEEEEAEEKLRRVGADQVILPHVIGGHRLAKAMVQPTVVQFLEIATSSQLYDYQIEEFLITPDGPYAGKTIHEAKLLEDMNVMVVAIRRPDGQMERQPHGRSILEPNSVIVVVGRQDALEALRQLSDLP